MVKKREDQTPHLKEIKSVYSFTGSITIKASQNDFYLKSWGPVLKIFLQIITPLACCPVCPGFLLWLSEGVDCALRRPLSGLTLLVTHPLCLHSPAELFHLLEISTSLYFCHRLTGARKCS